MGQNGPNMCSVYHPKGSRIVLGQKPFLGPKLGILGVLHGRLPRRPRSPPSPLARPGIIWDDRRVYLGLSAGWKPTEVRGHT